MSFALLHKLVTYLISGLGLYALSLGGELGAAVTVGFFIAWGVSFFVEGERITRPNWNRAWNAIVVGFFFLQVLRGVFGGPLLALGVEYAGFLQLTRLFNRRTAADHQQIAVLAFLHLIAATVLSTDLAYGFVFVGFVVVTPWMLVLSHLRREIEGNYEQGEGATGPDVARVLGSRRIVGPGLLVLTAALTVPIFVMTVGLFLAFPRVGLGFLSFGDRGGQRTAGFGRNIELGDFGVIRDDPTVVMRVRLEDRAGREGAPPPYLPLRMRGTSFDRYDGRRWTRSDGDAQRARIDGDYYPIHRDVRPGDVELSVILDHLDQPVVFLPDRVVGVSVPPRIEGAVDRPREIDASHGFDFRYVDEDGLGLRYSAYVSGDPEERFFEGLDEADRARYLDLPDDVERVAALAAELTVGAQTDLERAQRVEAHLRDSGIYTYSLRMPPVGDSQPLDAFLFEARFGHCEYYSTAMAVMLRTLGVPTRNATGFVGATYNSYGEYYGVRHGDAHSWVEAYVDGRWQTFDPTPAARGEVRQEPGLVSDFRALMDALRTRWTREVVGYDLRSQVRGLRSVFRFMWKLRQDFDALMAGGADEAEPGGASDDAVTTDVAPIVGVATAAVLLGLLLFLALRLRRRRNRGEAQAPLRPEEVAAIGLYRELEKALTRRGHPRPESRTPREHARFLLAEGVEGADLVDEVTRGYEAARWGQGALSAAEMAHLRTRVTQIRDLGRT